MLIRKFTAVATLLLTTLSGIAEERVVSKEELSERVRGFRNGQLLGN